MWNIINGNKNLISIQRLKFTVTKRVFRMITESLQHQYGSHKHILAFSCDWVHHKGTLQRAKVLSMYKVGVDTYMWPLMTSKMYQKWSKYKWNDQNSFSKRSFVITTLYKRVPNSISSMLSHSNNNLFQNEVHYMYRTFLSISCMYRAGDFFDPSCCMETHWLLVRSHLLI